MKVSPPTFCFDCRIKRKAAFLNERTLFRRTCDQCSQSIISMYSPDSEYEVLCTSCYNDREDCLEYGTEYNFSKTFFEQFRELFKKVPRIHLRHRNNNEGCENSNHTYYCRNTYLAYNIVRSEDILYSKNVHEGNKICIDCQNINMNERGYELIDSLRNYNSRFLVRSSQCVDSEYLFNCANCTNCFMSSNLRNKSYMFRNKQLSREEYLQAMQDFPLDSYQIQEKIKGEFDNVCKNSICRFASMKNAENCTGDFIENSKNAKYSFSSVDTENSKYMIFTENAALDSYDLFFTGKNQSCYDITDAGSSSNNMMFSFAVSAGFNVAYCISSNNITNCFGCVGLQNKSYCILNKQYTKEEYEALVPKIIEQMNTMPYIDKKGIVYKYGEFFPLEFSPFAYNESLAYEEFPMHKEQVLEQGYLWRDIEEKNYKATMESRDLPDRLKDVSDKILEEVIACPNKGQVETKCTFAFRIVLDELRFYRLMNIPLPRYCPNCRYYERRKWKNPWKLWHRSCMCQKENHMHGTKKCEIEFETSYAPERPEIVYCEKCYQAEVY